MLRSLRTPRRRRAGTKALARKFRRATMASPLQRQPTRTSSPETLARSSTSTDSRHEVQSTVNQIFASTADVNQATSLAMAYIRGTPWYAQTYPGIQEGIAKGVINNEADYRSYLNSVNTLTQQYQGRQVGSSELAGYLQQGFSVDHVSASLCGTGVHRGEPQRYPIQHGSDGLAGPIVRNGLDGPWQRECRA